MAIKMAEVLFVCSIPEQWSLSVYRLMCKLSIESFIDPSRT